MYGIDTGDRALMRSRSWRWLTTRIVGLLRSERSRVRRVRYPPKDQQQ